MSLQDQNNEIENKAQERVLYFSTRPKGYIDFLDPDIFYFKHAQCYPLSNAANNKWQIQRLNGDGDNN